MKNTTINTGLRQTAIITLDGHLGNVDLKSGNEVTPGHVSSFGVPKILHIRNNMHILVYIYLTGFDMIIRNFKFKEY